MKRLVWRWFAGLFLLTSCSPSEDHAARANDPQPATQFSDARAIIADIGKINTPQGIEESFAVDIGGIEQWISIRGMDRSNPVLLVLHGGPGSTEMAAGWTFQRGWEDYFTVVQWDQRGAGRTYALNASSDGVSMLNIEQMTGDVIGLIDFLRDYLEQEKIVLLGHSWGTIIGLKAAIARPDAVSAYVGHGQVISMQQNEEEGFRLTLEAALADSNEGAIQALRALQPYPGGLTVERIGAQRAWSIYYGGLAAYRPDAASWFRSMRLSPEYDEVALDAFNKGSERSITALLPELGKVDLRSIQESPVPVFLLHGRHDLTTPPALSAEWLEKLKAPAKANYWFEHSAHLAFMEEPGKMLMTLVTCIRPYAVEFDIDLAHAKAERCLAPD